MATHDHGFDPSDVEVRRQFVEVIAFEPAALAVLKDDLGGDIDSIVLQCLAAELIETSMRVHELRQILGPLAARPADRPALRLVEAGDGGGK